MSPVPSALRAPLLDLPGVRHGFFTRAGGVSGGLYASLNIGQGSRDEPEAVAENRRRLAAAFGSQPEDLLVCHQIHSAEVVLADGRFAERPRADGVATARAGLVCVALHADCAPVLMADADAGVVAAVHAGWRGALAGVVEAGVAAMARLGARPERIRAAVGPCIGPGSYEVGPDFVGAFAADPDAARFFRDAAAPGKRLFDLPAYALERLRRAGVERREALGRDTLSEEALFFSNRRAVLRGEGDYGRLASAIARV